MTLPAVRNAALAVAGAEADGLRKEATARAVRLVGAARVEAASLVKERRAAAELLATRERRARVAAARAEARAIVLGAQQSVLAGASSAAHAAARELVSDPRYEHLIERLSGEVRERLGPIGTVEVTAAPGGGLLARAGNCEIDYSLDAQVDRCLEALAGELERLWR